MNDKTIAKGTRITWRTMQGTRSGKVLGFMSFKGYYEVQADGAQPRGSARPAKVYPQDIIKSY